MNRLSKMDINAVIKELLFGHDCVIIPDFGGFIGNYIPARIDKGSGTFYPPLKQISFNRNLNHNDGLLIKQISAVSELNYGDARRLLEEFVSNLRKRLERGEKVTFDKIGTFVNNDEGNVQFEPEAGINYHLDSFGLESFRFYPAENYDVRRKISGLTHKEFDRSHSFRKYLWRAAIIIPLAVGVATVSLKTDFFRQAVETTSMNPLANAEFEHNKAAVDQNMAETQLNVVPEIKDEAEPQPTITDTAVDETVTASPEPEKITQPLKQASVLTATHTYYIITGSFQSEDNAGRQVSQLQSEGFNPRLIGPANGFYRVCAMECPDLQTAIQKRDSILKKFPGSWVSRKK